MMESSATPPPAFHPDRQDRLAGYPATPGTRPCGQIDYALDSYQAQLSFRFYTYQAIWQAEFSCPGGELEPAELPRCPPLGPGAEVARMVDRDRRAGRGGRRDR